MKTNNVIDYYKINETLENKYYQIPQELFVNPEYNDKLNSDSKILYAFLLDRLTLSMKNNWVDEDNNIYLIFTRNEVMQKLNLSDKTVTKSFKQLSEVNLVKEKRQGLGKPNLIFVGKIKHQEIENFQDIENSNIKNRKNYESEIEKNTIQDAKNLRTINTNNNKTNNINPTSDYDEKFLEKIKHKSKLDEFDNVNKKLLENVIDKLYNSDTLKVGAVNINKSKIISKLELINKNNLIQLINIKQQSGDIKNLINYLAICLYNNLGNVNINLNSKSNKFSNKYIGREYSSDFLESLYTI